MKSKPKQLLTIEQLADFTQLKVTSLYRLSRDGKIPTVRISKKCIRFDPAEVLKMR